MSRNKIAKRYAQGLLQYTQDLGNIQSVYTEMKGVAQTIFASRELQLFFATPIIDSRKKKKVVESIFSNFSPLIKNFIHLVINQGRECYLGDIAATYQLMVEEIQGVQKVVLITASEIDQENIEEIVLSSSLVDVSKTYEVKSVIKPEIIGGYILRVGDQQIDNSVRKKLNSLKKVFQLN